MLDKNAIDYATLVPKPFDWGIVALPLIMAVGPILVAFFAFSFGYGGMMIAAFALLIGYVLSPAAAIVSIINCIRFRRNSGALVVSLFAIAVSAGALCFEIWRMNGEWD